MFMGSKKESLVQALYGRASWYVDTVLDCGLQGFAPVGGQMCQMRSIIVGIFSYHPDHAFHVPMPVDVVDLGFRRP